MEIFAVCAIKQNISQSSKKVPLLISDFTKFNCHEFFLFEKCYFYQFVQVFDGNTDAHSSDTIHIGPPIIAKAVRILPVVQYTQSVCLRLELYGCLWEGRWPLTSKFISCTFTFTAVSDTTVWVYPIHGHGRFMVT